MGCKVRGDIHEQHLYPGRNFTRRRSIRRVCRHRLERFEQFLQEFTDPE